MEAVRGLRKSTEIGLDPLPKSSASSKLVSGVDLEHYTFNVVFGRRDFAAAHFQKAFVLFTLSFTFQHSRRDAYGPSRCMPRMVSCR